MAKKSNTTVCKSKKVIDRLAQDGSKTLLNLEDFKCYFQLDGVALELWDLINDKRTESELISILQAKYPAYKADVQKKAKSFLQQLRAENLIE